MVRIPTLPSAVELDVNSLVHVLLEIKNVLLLETLLIVAGTALASCTAGTTMPSTTAITAASASSGTAATAAAMRWSICHFDLRTLVQVVLCFGVGDGDYVGSWMIGR